MTKAVPPNKRRKPGPKKGSGAGLDVVFVVRISVELDGALKAEAKATGSDASKIAREVLERWMKRKAKG